MRRPLPIERRRHSYRGCVTTFTILSRVNFRFFILTPAANVDGCVKCKNSTATLILSALRKDNEHRSREGTVETPTSMTNCSMQYGTVRSRTASRTHDDTSMKISIPNLALVVLIGPS